MAAALDAVFDAAQAFLGSVQAHIIQAYKVTGLLGTAAQPLGVAAGEGRFLGKIHAISKGGLDALHGQFAAPVLIAAALGCQLIRVNDDKVSALGPR